MVTLLKKLFVAPTPVRFVVTVTLPYKVSEVTGLVDMEKLAEKATEFRPKMLIVGASAYSRDWDYPAFRAVADSCGALMMVDMAHISGLVAAKVCGCVPVRVRAQSVWASTRCIRRSYLLVLRSVTNVIRAGM